MPLIFVVAFLSIAVLASIIAAKREENAAGGNQDREQSGHTPSDGSSDNEDARAGPGHAHASAGDSMDGV